MKREMVKKKLALTPAECENIIKNATSGVLALTGTNGYPYTVPMSYSYNEGRLWFHGAKIGMKMECIANNPKAAFSIIFDDRIIPKDRDTHFSSVNIFGNINIITDESEKLKGLRYLIERYSPGFEAGGEKDIKSLWSATAVFTLDPLHITGKAAKEIIDEIRG